VWEYPLQKKGLEKGEVALFCKKAVHQKPRTRVKRIAPKKGHQNRGFKKALLNKREDG